MWYNYCRDESTPELTLFFQGEALLPWSNWLCFPKSVSFLLSFTLSFAFLRFPHLDCQLGQVVTNGSKTPFLGVKVSTGLAIIILFDLGPWHAKEIAGGKFWINIIDEKSQLK